MMGCDYTETIKGVGPKNAYNLIKEHKTIDEAIKHLTPRLKDNIPPEWNYAEARELFIKPLVTPGESFDVKKEYIFVLYNIYYIYLVGLEGT
jgi:flap endonuclease-1